MTARPSWNDRYQELANHIGSTGRVPSQLGTAAERSLHSWLKAQRIKIKNGDLPKERTELLERLGAVAFQRPFADSVAALEAFYATHGRLPRNSKSADEHEQRLAIFLIQHVRTSFRKGLLSPEMTERLQATPGVLEVRTVQDQDSILQELAEYAKTNGHLPPLGGSGTRDENRLASWMRNNSRGSALAKTGKLRDRHLAVLALIDEYPTRSEALEEGRLKELAAFVKARGHRPSMGGTIYAEERSLGTWMHLHQTSPDPRMVAALKAPTRADVEWDAIFTMLARYAASHGGRLPGNWHEGRLFSWLTIQRREYRRGKMTAARLEKLLTIDGVIPRKTLLADAA